MIAGKYVLDRLLGKGGMGAVFAAKHIKLSKPVAIKIMLADASNPEAAQRFINEGRAAANIQNEHVVRVDDVDEEMGYAYMVLELLDGEDLAQLLEREPAQRLQPHVVVGYVIEALRGVAQAHAIGIVHRDLKPSNLFLARRKDGSVVVKVLDFGISKAQGSSALAASPSALTSTKAMLGSPLYMSPEQLRSSKSVDHRADIWAIGIILYELMTGTLPFMGDNLGELFAAILETDPTPVRQRADAVHPQLDQIILRCLARRADHRFQTAAELVTALTPFAVAAPGFTNAMPSSMHTLIQPGVRQTGPGAVASMTPNGGMVNPGSFSSSGNGPRMIGGTVAIGTSTPSNLQVTNGGWQSTGNGTGFQLQKSKAPFIAAIAAAVLAVFVVVSVVYIRSGKAVTDAPTVGSGVASGTPIASANPTTVPTAVSPDPKTTGSVEPALSATASATAVASAPTTPVTKPTSANTGHGRPGPFAGTATTAVVTKPGEPKPPEPKATETKPPVPTKPTNTGGLQNSR
jgi:eukaryotic-like serine/threonine-protein kinase